MLNPYHSPACEGCAGWKDMYEQALARIGQLNSVNDLLEARVDLVTIDHARDRRELREALAKAEATLGQYRAFVDSVWETVKTAINVLLPSYRKYEQELRRLAEMRGVEWPDPPVKMTAGVPDPEFLRRYGPGPRSGHLDIWGDDSSPRPEPLKMGRGSLPGMVPGSAGQRVVMCGSQCRQGHTYAEPCLLSLPRTEEQHQRYPGGGSAS